MSEKVEGTIVLDGLIQGKLPPTTDAVIALREWNQSARKVGLHFTLEIEGNQYNLLPDNRPIEVDSLGVRGVDQILDTLGELLDIYPPGSAGAVLSTIRSTEYRQNTEVQTLYAAGPDGRIHTREHATPALTVKPAAEMSGRDRVKLALIGLVIALAVFAVSAIFVPYRDLVHGFSEHAPSVGKDEITVDASRFAEMFRVVDIDPSSFWHGNVVIKLQRTDKFPHTDADLDRLAGQLGGRGAASQPDRSAATLPERSAASLPDRLGVGQQGQGGQSLKDRLVLEAVARGYVRCEMFDKNGKFFAVAEARIANLRDTDTCEITLPLSRNPRLARIVITY